MHSRVVVGSAVGWVVGVSVGESVGVGVVGHSEKHLTPQQASGHLSSGKWQHSPKAKICLQRAASPSSSRSPHGITSGNGIGGRVGDAVVTASVDLASTSIRPIIVADVIVLRFFLVLPRQFGCGTVAGIVAWPWCCSRCIICILSGFTDGDLV